MVSDEGVAILSWVSPSNRSVDADTHRQRAARRTGDRPPRGALPVRAGHSNVRLLVDALLLDLDGTLLDDRSAVRAALTEFLSASGCDLHESQALARWRELAAVHWGRFESGEISFEDQRRYRVREFLGAELTDAEADAAFEPYRIGYEAAWRSFPECARFFELTAHLPKVVLTNGHRVQQLLKIERCGIADHISAVITPEDCGAWKPDHRMFKCALERLRLPAFRCMMIGDDVERDIQPARELGLLTYHVDRNVPGASLLHALGPI